MSIIWIYQIISGWVMYNNNYSVHLRKELDYCYCQIDKLSKRPTKVYKETTEYLSDGYLTKSGEGSTDLEPIKELLPKNNLEW